MNRITNRSVDVKEVKMEDRKLLLTVASVMECTSLGRTKIYQLISSGEISSVRIGRAVRVPAKALQEWVNRQQESSQQGKN